MNQCDGTAEMLQDNNQNHGEGQQSFLKQLVTGIIDDQKAALRKARGGKQGGPRPRPRKEG